MSALSKIVKHKESRQLKKYYQMIDKINKREEIYARLTDEQLKMKTDQFKEMLENGQSIFDIAVDAFATVREVSKRVLGLRHYDVQLLGGLVLLEGKVAEMATGEGKTLVASLPSYLIALEGKGVHIITVNDYLAKRDKEMIGQIHEFLGLKVGLNVPGISNEEKQQAYNCDITYGVGTEFGFDYLRDNMVRSKDQKVQRPYHYAIVDEIDSVLIDEAKTPLIIASKDRPSARLYNVCAKLVKALREDEHYVVDRELKTANFTDEGLDKCEKVFGVKNLFELEHSSLFHALIQALRAKVLFEKDVDYIVEDNEIKLVDMNTGRIMEGRTLSDGLHQAIEAKEGVKNTEENKTQASITVQNYYRMYPKLAGMTGTAKTEETEFNTVYNMDVVQIPTNKPKIRKDLPDMVFWTKEQKYKQLVKEVKMRHASGQPILIGTTSILQSENVAEYLEKEGLKFQLLNAKSVQQEANLIALAGQKNQITIATNMAGRGTDIMLGEGVEELGGLHVIGTERNESRRIDDQLIGRSGRQGDPGSSQFIISLEDELFIRYAPDELERYKPKLKANKDGLITSPNVYKLVETAQKISEGVHSQFREYNLKLEDVINEQRDVMYTLRDKVLDAENPLTFFVTQFEDLYDELIEEFCHEDLLPEEWKLDELQKHLNNLLLPELSFEGQDFETVEEVKAFVHNIVEQHRNLLMEYEDNEEYQQTLKMTGLYIMDTLWQKHLEKMMLLKEGSGIRSYQQEDPIRLFKTEGLTIFEAMYNDLKYEIAIRMKRLVEQMEEKKNKPEN
ncbi:accessory Sec system translocase SecA2 [Gracilibacillus dipsosauri]|uniref:accessory Sec system translocase SecA2 n=1 Tax=Gracilibacillus dipsosauri TaxID=178340 RepID=UPI00240A2282